MRPKARCISLLLAALTACADASLVQPLDAELSRDQLCAKRDSLELLLPTHPTIDDQFELMAKLLPGGFAGLTSSMVYLKHFDQADRFARAVELAASCATPLPYLMYGHVGAISPADYDWVELRTWYRIIQAAVPMTANSSDINEATNRLHFTFTTQALLDQFRTRAIATGVPSGMLLLTIGGPVIVVDISVGA